MKRGKESIADFGEFDLIERIKRFAGARAESDKHVLIGIGDDAAVLRPSAGEVLVVSTDALVEDTHFRFSTQSPTAIGRRALAVNLSDLAAMGARPLGFTLALSLTPKLPIATFDRLIRGLLAEARRYDCPLVGGNLARAREVTLAVTVFGSAQPRRILRRGAVRPGDRLFVTGTLGGAALACRRAEAVGGQIRSGPQPRLAAGRALGRMVECRACVDISDGLVADLEHLLEGSGCGAALRIDALPLARGLRSGARALGLDPETLALTGGEDYELLFAVHSWKGRASALAERLGVAVTEIGTLTRESKIQGLPESLSTHGWRHF